MIFDALLVLKFFLAYWAVSFVACGLLFGKNMYKSAKNPWGFFFMFYAWIVGSLVWPAFELLKVFDCFVSRLLRR